MIKMEEKTKKKARWEGSGRLNENNVECGSANDEKRSCREVKNFQGCCMV